MEGGNPKRGNRVSEEKHPRAPDRRKEDIGDDSIEGIVRGRKRVFVRGVGLEREDARSTYWGKGSSFGGGRERGRNEKDQKGKGGPVGRINTKKRRRKKDTHPVNSVKGGREHWFISHTKMKKKGRGK